MRDIFERAADIIERDECLGSCVAIEEAQGRVFDDHAQSPALAFYNGLYRPQNGRLCWAFAADGSGWEMGEEGKNTRVIALCLAAAIFDAECTQPVHGTHA